MKNVLNERKTIFMLTYLTPNLFIHQTFYRLIILKLDCYIIN